jgi:hypothetical protein
MGLSYSLLETGDVRIVPILIMEPANKAMNLTTNAREDMPLVAGYGRRYPDPSGGRRSC